MKPPSDIVRTIALACSLLWLCAAGAGAGTTEAAPRAGGIPDYEAQTFEGKTTRLRDLRGKAVLLHAWASYCPLCRGHMPGLQELADRFGGAGLLVVGVNVDGEPDVSAAKRYLQGLNLSYPMWKDSAAGFARSFRYIGVPQFILIDRHGRMVKQWLGQFDPHSQETLRLIHQALAH